MKQGFFLLVILCLCAPLMAQVPDSVKAHPTQYGSVEFFGINYPCTVTDYDAPPDVVEKTIKEQLLSLGYKPSSRKGFLVYRNIRLSNVHNGEPVDLLILIEAKSRKEKETTTVHVITAEPGKIPDKRPEKGSINPETVVIGTGAAAMLSQMTSRVNEQEHARQLQLQQEVVLKAERHLKDLQNDYASMQKKVEQLQKDMEKNKKEQEAAAKQIQEEKKKLSELEANKPSTGN